MLVCVFRDLPLHKGEIITLLKRVDENWYEGFCNGRQGFLPANYIEVGISSILLMGPHSWYMHQIEASKRQLT